MNVFQRVLILMIRLYQIVISPLVVAFLGPSARCRFTPSCSQYARDAIRLHGAVAGGWLGLRRLARCHPWGACGDDPVPIPGTACVSHAMFGVPPNTSSETFPENAHKARPVTAGTVALATGRSDICHGS